MGRKRPLENDGVGQSDENPSKRAKTGDDSNSSDMQVQVEEKSQEDLSAAAAQKPQIPPSSSGMEITTVEKVEEKIHQLVLAPKNDDQDQSGKNTKNIKKQAKILNKQIVEKAWKAIKEDIENLDFKELPSCLNKLHKMEKAPYYLKLSRSIIKKINELSSNNLENELENLSKKKDDLKKNRDKLIQNKNYYWNLLEAIEEIEEAIEEIEEKIEEIEKIGVGIKKEIEDRPTKKILLSSALGKVLELHIDESKGLLSSTIELYLKDLIKSDLSIVKKHIEKLLKLNEAKKIDYISLGNIITTIIGRKDITNNQKHDTIKLILDLPEASKIENIYEHPNNNGWDGILRALYNSCKKSPQVQIAGIQPISLDETAKQILDLIKEHFNNKVIANKDDSEKFNNTVRLCCANS